MKKLNIGIVGGSGYTAGELIRILRFHPNLKKMTIVSTSNSGSMISCIHDDLLDDSRKFTSHLEGKEDIVFLCLEHGISPKYITENQILNSTKIIDLSNDFRLKSNRTFLKKEFIYGLPELNKSSIVNASYIANPGCFATAIQLALLPLAKNNLLQNKIHVFAITGSSGTGRNLSNSNNFSWRNNNISSYKEFTHQHLTEIQESLMQVQKKFNQTIHFIPYRGNFTRGIFSSIYTKFEGNIEQAKYLFKEYYKNELFVKISTKPIHLKQVVATNFCYLYLIKHKNQLLINSVIDNLIKGASGQAIQNMNLMFGLKENLGLNLKATYF